MAIDSNVNTQIDDRPSSREYEISQAITGSACNPAKQMSYKHT